MEHYFLPFIRYMISICFVWKQTRKLTSIYVLKKQNAKNWSALALNFVYTSFIFYPFFFWYFIIYLEHKIYCYISENISFPEFTSNLFTYVHPHRYIIIELFNHTQGSFGFFLEKRNGSPQHRKFA